MPEKKETILVVFLWWLWTENGSLVMITDELSLSKTGLAGDQLTKPDLSRFSYFASLSCGDTSLFSGSSHRTDSA